MATIFTAANAGLDFRTLDFTRLLSPFGERTADFAAVNFQGNGNPNIQIFGTGFTYNGQGVPTGGTLNALTDNAGGNRVLTVAGLNVDLAQISALVAQGNNQGALSLMFAGNDSVIGGNQADYLRGYAGNDVLSGGNARDALEGGAGNDVLDGGRGVDTAVYAGARGQYTVALQAGGGFVVTGAEGTDTLISIERVAFSDGQLSTADAAGATGVIQRFYNTQTGRHFYTANNAEAENVRTNLPQFEDEGLVFRSASPGNADVFRFYNADTQSHFYTASVAERDAIIGNLPQFRYEGAAYRAWTGDQGPQEELYRFYNTATGAHFYTISEAERDSITASLPTFKYEGVAFFVDVI